MTTRIRRAIVAAGALCLAGGAIAQSAVDGAVKARKAHMQLYAFNLGALGAMAKGEVEYDAAAAGAAAANIAALATLDQSRYWPQGSAQGEAEGSRALPALWTSGDDVMAKAGAFREAVGALATAAGTDLASLQAAMGPVGQACGSCHESFRAAD
ncbi:MAG: cytochrome c [Rhodobacteraceae bacterium]|jgi:cytochrome c556|nr:cytochrome c [Paracoccaceae bacterium]